MPLEAANFATASIGVARDIAIEVIGTDATMARGAIVSGRRYRSRAENQRQPIDTDAEFVSHRGGRRNGEIRLRTFEIDRDRQSSFVGRALRRNLLVGDVGRRAVATGEHPANTRKMLASEKLLAVDDVGWHPEYS